MNTIENTTAGSASQIQALNGAKADSKTAQEAQDRFLTLLVTQLKNQDPLNPLDNAQVTSQLAQLSTVSGIEKLNTAVESLNASYLNTQALQAANLIGHGVLTPGASLDLVEGKSVYGLEFKEPVDSVEVAIKDSAKRTVRTITLGAQEAGSLPLTWDGLTDGGAKSADGRYSIEVTASRSGKSVSGASALTFNLVSSVSSGAQGAKLHLPGGGLVNFSDVRQIL